MSDPDPSIEEIERAIRKARFDESDTERFLRDRAHVQARKIAAQNYKDQKLKLAYRAGYRDAWGKANPKKVAFYTSHITLIAVTLIALAVFQAYF